MRSDIKKMRGRWPWGGEREREKREGERERMYVYYWKTYKNVSFSTPPPHSFFMINDLTGMP